MMVRPEPERVVERIAEMAGSTWPTSEPERQSWFAQLGLPVDGEPLTARDGLVPHDIQFAGPPRGEWPETSWHVHRGRFVGVHWFLWADEDEDATRAAAESLRTHLCARWPAIEELSGPAGGFTTLWRPGDSRIDLYYHAPRTDLAPPTTPGVVQLHVENHARADAAEVEARTTTRPISSSRGGELLGGSIGSDRIGDADHHSPASPSATSPTY